LPRQKFVLTKSCSKPSRCLQLLEERSAAVKKSKKPKRKKKGSSDAAPLDADQPDQSGIAQPSSTQPLPSKTTELLPRSTPKVASQDPAADPLNQPLILEETELLPAGSNPYVEKPQLLLEAAMEVLASGDPSKGGPTDARKLLLGEGAAEVGNDMEKSTEGQEANLSWWKVPTRFGWTLLTPYLRRVEKRQLSWKAGVRYGFAPLS
jgi:hypothetical protein